MSSSPLEGVATGSITYALNAIGYSNCFMTGVRPQTSRTSFCGRARTLRTLPLRPDVVAANRKDRSQDPHRVALDQVSGGEVVVIDARGVLDAAVCGDLLAARVKYAGGAAIVTDGSVRDLPGLIALDFPIYSQALHAAAFSSKHLGIGVNQPISCGGVLVMPGDLLVGDGEGVVVVPAELEHQVAGMIAEQEQLDAFVLEQLRAGRPLNGLYPPNPRTRDEFERWRER